MKITAIHFRKLSAVTEMKMRTLMSKNFIIMPIFSLGFTFLMKILYRSIADGKINMDGYALSLGVLMNISMSVYCTAAALAEEKEKNTLRTLMTSSVNGLEFFLGSIIPVIILSTAVNVLCVFIVQLTLSGSPMGRISYHYDSLHFHCICRRHDLRYLCQNPSIRKYDHYACAHYIYDGSDVVRIQQHFRKDLKSSLHRNCP